ncbi:ATP-binding cassette domain-containing protein [Streptomyces asoensis]|uniref:ATP-binding cassette domain-containing protein n=1 Tax=Streptomyces asoensis TaxID=249586 RepID=UPI00167518C2|nr:ATP-binding cassette domain-containing protein [Streptomyces asoensis]
MIQAFGLTSNSRKALPPAVDDVSFEARAGRVTVLLGASGAGKTTVLRLLLELEQGRGLAYFRGRPLHRIAHPSREVGVLLGDVPGHPARTVRGHLRMLCAAAGVPARRADEVLEVVGLVSLRDERLGTLSRGMDRRLGLACALLADPHTLVLDDPAAGLSGRESRWLYGMLRAHADQGGTVLTTTADPKEAARTADRVVTLDRGALVADQEVADFGRTRLRPRVAVRSPHAARLATLLTREARAAQRSVEVVQEDGNRLSVYGSSCAHVGETAFKHNVLVHQLADETGDMGPGAGVAAPRRTRSDAMRGVSEQADAAGQAGEGAPSLEPSANVAVRTGPERTDVPGDTCVANAADAVNSARGIGVAVGMLKPGGDVRPTPSAPYRSAEESPYATVRASEGDLRSDVASSPSAGSAAGVRRTQSAMADPSTRSAARSMTDPGSRSTRSAEPSAPEGSAAAALTVRTDPSTDGPRPPEAADVAHRADHTGRTAHADRTDDSDRTDQAAPDARPAASGSPLAPLMPPARRSGRRSAARPFDTLPGLPPPISVRSAPSPLRPLRYELRRATGISTGFLTAAAVLAVSALTAVLLARVGHTPRARLLAAWPAELPLPPAALGAGLLGALAFGDEFRHPALAADRGTVPRRLGVLTAKLLVAALTALALAFLTVGCDAEALYLVYGQEVARVPADWLALGASWFGLVVGCAWTGVLAAGVFRSTTAGLAAVVAMPVVVLPVVQKVAEGSSVRTAAGISVRLRELLLVQWPFGGDRYVAAAARVIVQPVGGAMALSLAALMCAYLITTVRSRVR